MIAIETDDAETFTISQGGVVITTSRSELEIFLDEANILLLVTEDRQILELDDI